ncbi:hypothetical protein RRG08_015018 [Elysia crispata]|uniref:Uncharacterized protein n=1 Tax=Elysia crispata TaxID=231223 RepID=A0AAE0YXM7_9GAST|nr:hypothetical protein RRG08_015018 [Elysia crispata]
MVHWNPEGCGSAPICLGTGIEAGNRLLIPSQARLCQSDSEHLRKAEGSTLAEHLIETVLEIHHSAPSRLNSDAPLTSTMSQDNIK